MQACEKQAFPDVKKKRGGASGVPSLEPILNIKAVIKKKNVQK